MFLNGITSKFTFYGHETCKLLFKEITQSFNFHRIIVLRCIYCCLFENTIISLSDKRCNILSKIAYFIFGLQIPLRVKKGFVPV